MKPESIIILVCSLALALVTALTGVLLYQRGSAQVGDAPQTEAVSAPWETDEPRETDETDAQTEPAQTDAPQTEEQSETVQTDLPVGPSELADPLIPSNPPVEDAWFADALFIGDSRTDGLSLYSELPAAFYSDTSLNISKLTTSKFLYDDDGNECTLLERLQADAEGNDSSPFTKIYFWMGLNDVGGDSAFFIRKYQAAIDSVHQFFPDAKVYVVAIVPVSKSFSESSRYGVTNENITRFNEAIRVMAEENGYVFLDASVPFADETGALRATTLDGKKLSEDGAHFTKSGVREFFTYIRTHVAPHFEWTGPNPEET